MELVPKEIVCTLPPLRSRQKHGADAIAQVRFHAPWIKWRWYASEYNPILGVFYGVVVIFEREYDYFTLDALETIRSRSGQHVERDLTWTPRPLRECE